MSSQFRNELIASAAEQLSRDYCCAAKDFLGLENKVTLARIETGRRVFRDQPDFFKAAAMGRCAVISSASEMLEFSSELASKYSGAEIFDQKRIWLINRKLADYNKAIAVSNIFYLPATPYRYAAKDGFRLKFYEESEIVSELYPIGGFSNALMYRAGGTRRDVLAVCAFNGRRIVGMAGASSDSPRFWQIGVDVLENYRGLGIGSELVSALTQAVFMHGAIPYYGTWSGNIASQNTARRAGYYPVWSEMNAFDIE